MLSNGPPYRSNRSIGPTIRYVMNNECTLPEINKPLKIDWKTTFLLGRTTSKARLVSGRVYLVCNKKCKNEYKRWLKPHHEGDMPSVESDILTLYWLYQRLCIHIYAYTNFHLIHLPTYISTCVYMYRFMDIMYMRTRRAMLFGLYTLSNIKGVKLCVCIYIYIYRYNYMYFHFDTSIYTCKFVWYVCICRSTASPSHQKKELEQTTLYPSWIILTIFIKSYTPVI